eukprot:2396843-Pleurochrysis_carterae.AAC.3
MPLASVVTTRVPTASVPAKAARGASGTPSFSATRDDATSSRAAQSCAARLPSRSCSHSSACRQPLAVPPPAGRVTAYPPRSTSRSSGSTCDMFASLPTTDRALRQRTRLELARSARISAMVVRRSARFPSGQRRRPSPRLTHIARATIGSPTAILAGAAWRPSFASPSAVSCACTCARVRGSAGVPPAASMCRGSMVSVDTLAGGSTGSSSDTPLRAPCRPVADRGRRRLVLVEGCLFPLHPRRDQRRDAFEPVGRKGPPEAHPLVDDDARTPVRVPPYKAEHPPVRPLNRAEPVGGLGVRYVCYRARLPLARGGRRTGRVKYR